MSVEEDITRLETKWVGNSCGRHGSCVFYKAINFTSKRKNQELNHEKILGLGEFFFLQFREEDPVCIGELQLLWHDKQSDQDLSSSRLYYVPETTPSGRTNLHGQDEVIAFADKVVMKTSVLSSCVIEPRRWGYGAKAPVVHDSLKATISPLDRFAFSRQAFNVADLQQQRKKLEYKNGASDVKVIVLSSAQYNRHVTLLKRVGEYENCSDVIQKQLPFLGLFVTSHPNTRIVFARKTFESNAVNCRSFLQEHTAPVFKGRPRKKSRKFAALKTEGRKKPTTAEEKEKVDNNLNLRRRSCRIKTSVGSFQDFGLIVYGESDKLTNKRKGRLSSQKVVINETTSDFRREISSKINSTDAQDINSLEISFGTRKSNRKRTKVSPTPGSIPTDKIDHLLDSGDEIYENFTENDEEVRRINCKSNRKSKRRSSVTESSSLSTTPSSTRKLNSSKSPSVERSASTISYTSDSDASEMSLKRKYSPLPMNAIPTDENSFYELLNGYMKQRDTPINKIPSLGFKKLDLWAFFKLSQEYGGYDMITTKRLWKHVYDRMGGNPSCTSAATCTRKHYEKLLLPFENHIKQVRKNQYKLMDLHKNFTLSKSKGAFPKVQRHTSDPIPQRVSDGNKLIKQRISPLTLQRTSPLLSENLPGDVSNPTSAFAVIPRPKKVSPSVELQESKNMAATNLSIAAVSNNKPKIGVSLPPSKRYLQEMSKLKSLDLPKETNGKLDGVMEEKELEIKSAGLPSPDHRAIVERHSKSASPIHTSRINLPQNKPQATSFDRMISSLQTNHFPSNPRLSAPPPPYVPRKNNVSSLMHQLTSPVSLVSDSMSMKRRSAEEDYSSTPAKISRLNEGCNSQTQQRILLPTLHHRSLIGHRQSPFSTPEKSSNVIKANHNSKLIRREHSPNRYYNKHLNNSTSPATDRRMEDSASYHRPQRTPMHSNYLPNLSVNHKPRHTPNGEGLIKDIPVPSYSAFSSPENRGNFHAALDRIPAPYYGLRPGLPSIPPIPTATVGHAVESLQHYLNLQRAMSLDVPKHFLQGLRPHMSPQMPGMVPDYTALSRQANLAFLNMDTINAMSEFTANIKKEFQRMAALHDSQ